MRPNHVELSIARKKYETVMGSAYATYDKRTITSAHGDLMDIDVDQLLRVCIHIPLHHFNHLI